MSEHDWTPKKPEGLVGLKVEEYERLKADSERLDKLERAIRAGYSFDAYHWDAEKNEFGKAGIGVCYAELKPNLREAIDSWEKRP